MLIVCVLCEDVDGMEHHSHHRHRAVGRGAIAFAPADRIAGERAAGGGERAKINAMANGNAKDSHRPAAIDLT